MGSKDRIKRRLPTNVVEDSFTFNPFNGTLYLRQDWRYLFRENKKVQAIIFKNDGGMFIFSPEANNRQLIKMMLSLIRRMIDDLPVQLKIEADEK